MVPTLSIVFMVAAALIALALPVALCIYLHKRGANLNAFLVGALVMLLSAFVLESIAHQLILSTFVGSVIQANPWLYAIYGGLMAGLFEETGRLLAFKKFLKKYQDNDINAIMYGAGHGGLEAMVVLGMATINNIVWSSMINSGNTAALLGDLTGAQLAEAERSIDALIHYPSYLFLLGGVERVFAIAIQIALSVMVWFAAKKKDKWYLYTQAILLHLFVDASTVILSSYGVSTILLEVVVGVLAVVCVLLAKMIYKRNHVPEEEVA